MRRSPSRSARRALWLLASGAACLTAPLARASAQSDISKEGAIFLLSPIGARAVGTGQAMVASEVGSSGVWWNPASIARMHEKELTIDYSSTFAANGLAFSGALPAGRAGVFAVEAYVLDLGAQEATDQFGPIGTLLPRDIVLGATYAATIGRRLSAGVTYKLVQQRVDCTGACGNLPLTTSSTGAFDLGAQFAVDSARHLVLGAGIRNYGFKLQVNDVDQSDPLPTRIHAGARYEVPGVSARVPDGEPALMGELVTRGAFDQLWARGGAEFTYKKQFFLRAGYASASGDGAGASIGFGARRGAISFDFARSFGGVSADAGKPPTYVTMRFGF
ncbi:MAG: PorV/PorQ family protein [Gemmatimonadetes bacterium]|nr:PorV/PorQ family protein [Gemmatimonadota bacterium]